MQKIRPTSKVTLTGNKKAGWVIEVSDKKGNFKCDIAVTSEEAKMLLNLLEKKL